MDAGLAIVLAVLGVFLLVPLAFAWVSTNPRRWAGRAGAGSGAAGRARTGAVGCRRWDWGRGALYLVMGVYGLLVAAPFRRMAGFWLLQGAMFLGIGVGQYLHVRRP